MKTRKVYNVTQSTAEVIIWALQQYIVSKVNEEIKFTPKSTIMQLMYSRFAGEIEEIAGQIMEDNAQVMALSSGYIYIAHEGLSYASVSFLGLSNPPSVSEIVNRNAEAGPVPEFSLLRTCNKQEQYI